MHKEFAQTSLKAMSLSMEVRGATIMEILSLCAGVENLALLPRSDDFFDDGAPLRKLLAVIPLKVLTFQLIIFVDHASAVNIFATLTHLEIDNDDVIEHIEMDSLPWLTHLSLWWRSDSTWANVSSFVKGILTRPTLQVLFFRVEYHAYVAWILEYREKVFDPRIVLAPSSLYLWDELGRASMLLWEVTEDDCDDDTFAEGFIFPV
jgi:hypothetical protein